MTTPRIIGLTGGVGMGKSTVARYLQTQHGLPVLDADQYARAAVQVGSPIWQRLRDRYGDSILQPDGELDRAQLGQIVFSQAAERRWLEAQIHPDVRDRLHQAQAELLTAPILIYDIPLLFEAQFTDLVTEIWVVVCSLDQQIQRLRDRDRLTLDQIHARIASQWPIAVKAQHADVVLPNEGTLADLFTRIDAALAKSPSSPPPTNGAKSSATKPQP